MAKDFGFYDHSIRELSGKVMGIFGYGAIGKRVSQVATMFGMKVMAHTRSPHKEIHPPVDLVDRDTLFSEADIISLHAPLNDETHHLINAERIGQMKSTAILINTARGDLINEMDLAEALTNGRLMAAGLDTLSQEPPPADHPLFGIGNCIITPHQAWASYESRQRLLEGIGENIRGYLSGKLIHRIN